MAQLAADYGEIVGGVEAAASAAQALEQFYRWDALRRGFATWASLTELHFQQDTYNSQYKAGIDLLNELRPKITGFDVKVKRAFLASPLRAEVARALGRLPFRTLGNGRNRLRSIHRSLARS